MAETNLSALQATDALRGLKEVRDGTDRRAAGLSLMVWALVLTSLAGSLLAYGFGMFILAEKKGGYGSGEWLLLVATLFVIFAFWVVLGVILQRVVFSSFSIRRAPGDKAWKSALVAAGVVLASFLLFGGLQEVMPAIQGITPDQYDVLNHNIGTATALWISGTVFLAILMTQGKLGLPRGRAAACAIGAMVFGQLATFLWFPDMGITGAVAALLVLPLGLIGFGLQLWRQG